MKLYLKFLIWEDGDEALPERSEEKRAPDCAQDNEKLGHWSSFTVYAQDLPVLNRTPFPQTT